MRTHACTTSSRRTGHLQIQRVPTSHVMCPVCIGLINAEFTEDEPQCFRSVGCGDATKQWRTLGDFPEKGSKRVNGTCGLPQPKTHWPPGKVCSSAPATAHTSNYELACCLAVCSSCSRTCPRPLLHDGKVPTTDLLCSRSTRVSFVSDRRD
jgi:hypothetical protein